MTKKKTIENVKYVVIEGVKYVDSRGYYMHLVDGKLHSVNDKPARMSHAGHLKEWYKDGLLHRDGDRPSAVWTNGSQFWYKEGKLHRDDDKPAMIYFDGEQKWHKEGKLHRDDDKPAIICANGTQEWYKNGLRHRGGDKPTVMFWNGNQEWHTEGTLIRSTNKSTAKSPNTIQDDTGKPNSVIPDVTTALTGMERMCKTSDISSVISHTKASLQHAIACDNMEDAERLFNALKALKK